MAARFRILSRVLLAAVLLMILGLTRMIDLRREL